MVRVLAKLEPGGAQLAALRIALALAARGVSTRFVAGEATADGLALYARAGVAVEVYGGEGGLQYSTSEAFSTWLAPRLAGTELVHAHMAGAWWAAATALAEHPAVPLVASEHNRVVWPGGCPAAALARALARVDLFFAHGAPARELVLSLGLARARHVEGRSPIVGLDARPRPGLPRPRIVYSGRLHPEKGPDVLLEALARLQAPPQTIFLGDGPLRGALLERAAALGIAGKVSFPGWVSDPAPYVAGADVQVVPSRDEAWSQSAVLAMGLGVPVIGSAVPGLDQTLAAGRGQLVAPDDPGALAAAIGRVLAGERPDARPGRSYARRFALDPVARYYLGAYERLLRGRIGSAARRVAVHAAYG